MFNFYLKVELEKSKSYKFWVRDIRLASFLEKHFVNCRVVLEIHQYPSVYELSYLRQLGDRVLICPISEATRSKVEELKLVSRAVLLPMGVPDHFYLENTDELVPEFHAGYFGSFINSGRSQGISRLIEDFIPYLNENSSAKLLLVGIGKEGESFLEDLEFPPGVRERIVAHGYVEHSEIPGLMRQCGVLVLPYPEGEFFAARFPIKAMEYAASRRRILCTRTISHLNIFTTILF
jgi:glycosyltransferase involved in cell wall biosynthesis